MDKDTLCRLCATGLVLKNAHNVFKDENFQRHESLKHLISLYLRININIEDNMPSVVCNSCCSKILDFHTFAIECNKVQEHLKNFPLRPYICDPIKIEESLLVKCESFNDDFSDTEDNKPLMEGTFHSSEIHAKLEVQLDEGDKDDYYSSKKSASSKSKNQSSGKIRKRHSSAKHDDDDEDDCDSSKMSASRKLKSQSKKRTNAKNENETKIVKAKKKRDPNDTFLDFICSLCGKSFGYRDALTRHVKTHTPKEEYTFICSQCPKKFLTAKSLRLHEATHIPKETRLVFSCTQCDSKFTTKGNLQSHIRAVHENTRPYVCDICGYACTIRGTLQDHLLVHTEERPFPCPSCSQKFKSKSHVQRHLKNHHNEIKIQCPHCPMMLKNRRTLQKHLNVHKDIFEFNCSICNKGFHKNLTYMRHLNSHNGLRPFSCSWCSKTFAGSSSLQFHIKKMHPIEYAEYDGAGENNSVTRMTSSMWTDPASNIGKLG